MEQSRLKIYRTGIDIWLGISLVVIAVFIYFFVVVSVEMADFCGHGEIERAGLLKPLYQYAGCVIDWRSFFGEFVFCMQVWFCVLIFPALLARNYVREKTRICARKKYYILLFLFTILVCYFWGYYGFIDIPALNETVLDTALKIAFITLITMIPIHYFIELTFFLQKKLRRGGG